jgi:hypothetical protein
MFGFRRKKKVRKSIPELYYTPELLRKIKAYRKGIREEWERMQEINYFDEWRLKKL